MRIIPHLPIKLRPLLRVFGFRLRILISSVKLRERESTADSILSLVGFPRTLYTRAMISKSESGIAWVDGDSVITMRLSCEGLVDIRIPPIKYRDGHPEA